MILEKCVIKENNSVHKTTKRDGEEISEQIRECCRRLNIEYCRDDFGVEFITVGPYTLSSDYTKFYDSGEDVVTFEIFSPYRTDFKFNIKCSKMSEIYHGLIYLQRILMHMYEEEYVD